MRLLPRITPRESYVATTLLLMMLLSALLVTITVFFGWRPAWWLGDLTRIGAAILAAATTGVFLRRSPKLASGVTWRAYAQAYLSLALFQCFAGLWLLTTGRTASRFGSHHAPRETSVWNFGLALGFALLAVGCGVLTERTRGGAGHPARDR